jgi:hypothetical protein
MKIPRVNKGVFQKSWDVSLAKKATPAGQPEATHSLENARSKSISGNQRDQVIFQPVSNNLNNLLQQIR